MRPAGRLPHRGRSASPKASELPAATPRAQRERWIPDRRQTSLGSAASSQRRWSRVPETDDTDIREFLDHDYERMVAGLTLMTGSQAMAEDAVQEALARAWERMDRGQRFDSLKAWVTVVATNLIRSGLRRLYAERRARARLTAPDRPTGALERSEDRMDVIVAVRALPRRQREA